MTKAIGILRMAAAIGTIAALPTVAVAAGEMRIAVYQPAGLGCPQFEVAQENGYFADEGITFQPVYVQSGPQVAQLFAAGDIDAGCGGITTWIIAKSKGVDVRVVFSTAKGNAPLVARAGIDKIEDLEGKRCGTPGLGTIHDDNLSAFAKQNDLNIQHVYGVGMTSVVAMFENGEIDCMTGWEPHLAIASERLGGKYLVDFMRPDSMESVDFAVTDAFAAAQPDAAQGFVRALYKGAQFIKQRPQEAHALLARLLELEEVVVSEAYKRTVVTESYVDIDSSLVALNEAVAGGKVQASEVGDASAFLAGLVDHSFLQEAEKSLNESQWKP